MLVLGILVYGQYLISGQSKNQNNKNKIITPFHNAGSVDEETRKEQNIIKLAEEMNYPALVEVLQKCKDSKMKEQVYGIVKGYYPDYITHVEWRDDDVVFTLNGAEIWYADGKLLSEESLALQDNYRPIIYTYSTDSIYDIFDKLPKPNVNFSTNYMRSSDFQYELIGGKSVNIESQIISVRVLGITVRLHPVAARYAQLASQEVLELSKTDKEVKKFINDLRTISGYVNRKVRKSTNISMHSFGLALDLIPYDYKNKVTYWQWARVFYPDTWPDIPLEQRWLINEDVVRIFEKYGFVWGGKWPIYDTMHLEFRPELIYYGEARKVTGTPLNFKSFEKLMNNNQEIDTEQR